MDIGLAHAVNAFATPAEWVPVVFSLVAPLLLAGGDGAGRAPALGAARRAGRRAAGGPRAGPGWSAGGRSPSGSRGLLFHLDSAFFEEQTLKNLVYTAPFAAPLAYTGVGLLLILDRMVDAAVGRVGAVGGPAGAGRVRRATSC